MTSVNGRLVFGPPKNHQHRTVAFPKLLRQPLTEAIDGKAPDAFVFTTGNGQVLRANNFLRRTLRPATVAASVPPVVTHELRHTAASLAIASGASIKAVQSMLGHRTATMTLDLYGHLFGDEMDALAGRLDAAAEAAFQMVADSVRTLAVAD